MGCASPKQGGSDFPAGLGGLEKSWCPEPAGMRCMALRSAATAEDKNPHRMSWSWRWCGWMMTGDHQLLYFTVSSLLNFVFFLEGKKVDCLLLS